MGRKLSPGRALALPAVLAAAAAFPAVARATHDVAITLSPPDFTNSPNATFEFTSSDSPQFQCKRDAEPAFTACSSPQAYSSLAEGQHTFMVRGFSAAGGPGPAVSRTWTVDFTAPETMLTASPPALTNSSTATFEFTSPDATATFQCSLNGSPFAGCTSPQTYAGLADATRNFKVRAVDPATNTDFTPPSVDWTVDATPPDTTITDGPGAQSNLKQPTLQFTSSEAPSTFQCAVNGGAFVACSSPNVLAALADGAITFQARAIDGAGNVDPTPAVRSWTLDTVPPGQPAVWIGPRPPQRSAAKLSQARKARVTSRFQTTTQLRVEWTAAAGAASYDAEYRLTFPGQPPGQGVWKAWKTNVTARKFNAVVETGVTGCFRARSTDAVGNNSEWDVRCTSVPYKATKAFLFPPFTKQTGAGYFGGQYARRSGAGTPAGFLRLQLTPGNAPQHPPVAGLPAVVKRIILLVTKCPNCGKIRVLVTKDGTPPISAAQAVVDKTFDLTAATTKKKRVVTVVTFSSANPTLDRRYIYVLAAGPNATRRVEGIGVSPL